MSEEEINAFLATGRSAMTGLAQGGEQLKKWSDSFEQRGGAPVYGDDALQIVTLSNDFQAWLTPERRAIIANLRIDV
jgi:hypothetical protein